MNDEKAAGDTGGSEPASRWRAATGVESRIFLMRLRGGVNECGRAWVGRVFGAPVHVGGVVVHFEKVGLLVKVDGPEIVFAMRIVVFGEFAKAANTLKQLREIAFGNGRDAIRHDDFATGKRSAKLVIELPDAGGGLSVL
jgi:hypothetical protein